MLRAIQASELLFLWYVLSVFFGVLLLWFIGGLAASATGGVDFACASSSRALFVFRKPASSEAEFEYRDVRS